MTDKSPRGYTVCGLIGPAPRGLASTRKCLLCGYRNYCHTMLKVGVRHYVHARCGVDNDPTILDRMPEWILRQMPLDAFEGQPRSMFAAVMRRVRAEVSCG